MKKQPPLNTPAKTAVSIIRPTATVIIEIQGVTHRMTEAEAKDLHAKITSALGIFPSLLQQPRQDQTCPFPSSCLPNHWLSPTPTRPYWDDNKIMC